VTAGRLNVRNAPNAITGDIITRINRGETYPVQELSLNNNWARINVNGTVGWVSTAYVNIANVTQLPVTGGDEFNGYTVTATPYTVNIRSGPGTQFADIGNLPAGQSAQVIGRNAASTWWQVNYRDVVGWVSGAFTRLETGANINQIQVTNN
jgi:N-acetylmuramoyl-L-alanine amidase